MHETRKLRCLIVGMGGISRGMHAVLKTKPWYAVLSASWTSPTPGSRRAAR